MLHDAQRTSAPSACSVSISTAVWIVMCKLPAMRAPRSGASGANSSRIAISPGISVSAMAISLRPQSARSRSATLKSQNSAFSVTAFIVSLRSYRATRWTEWITRPLPRIAVQRAPLQWWREARPEPGPARSLHCRGLQRSSGRMERRLYPILRSSHRRFGGEQRVGQARFPLIKALGMKRLLEHEQLIVEVMAKLVNERTQKRLERDNLPPLRRAHPDGDPRFSSSLLRFVKAVQLAVVARWTLRKHPHAHRRNLVTAHQRIDQPLARQLSPSAVFAQKCRAYLRDEDAGRHVGRQPNGFNCIAFAVDPLARRG